MRGYITRGLYRLDSHLPEWARRMFRNPEWQKSSLFSAAVWVLGTVIIYKLVEKLGYGLLVNAAVSAVIDFVLYLCNKRWAFHARKVGYRSSGTRNTLVWVFFFFVNLGFGWILFNRTDTGTLEVRGIMACYGILVANPMMFYIRDKAVFSNVTFKEVLLSSWRVIRKTVKA